MLRLYPIVRAMEILTAEGVTSSDQMVRRWIREGKLKAKHGPKKTGYVIEGQDLEEFIDGHRSPAHKAARAKLLELDQELKQANGQIRSLQEENERLKRQIAK